MDTQTLKKDYLDEKKKELVPKMVDLEIGIAVLEQMKPDLVVHKIPKETEDKKGNVITTYTEIKASQALDHSRQELKDYETRLRVIDNLYNSNK